MVDTFEPFSHQDFRYLCERRARLVADAINLIGLYTPVVPGNWSPVPTTDSAALDQLASSVSTLPGLAATVASHTTSIATLNSEVSTINTSLTAVQINALLASEPVSTTNYAATMTGSVLTLEAWTSNPGNLLKSIAYTYNGITLTQEVRQVYAPDGVTVIGQLTIAYSYSGGVVASATYTRGI